MRKIGPTDWMLTIVKDQGEKLTEIQEYLATDVYYRETHQLLPLQNEAKSRKEIKGLRFIR